MTGSDGRRWLTVAFVLMSTGCFHIVPRGSVRPDASVRGQRPAPTGRMQCAVSVRNASEHPMEVTFSVYSQGGSRSGALGVLPASGSAQVVAMCGETVVARGVGAGKATEGSATATEDGDASIDLRIRAKP